jgi:hypothetical protein
MEQPPINMNTAIFVGIDSHPSEHTAVAINRFEDEKGVLRFENTPQGIKECLTWLATLTVDKQQLVIGIEGGETRHTLDLLSASLTMPLIYCHINSFR